MLNSDIHINSKMGDKLVVESSVHEKNGHRWVSVQLRLTNGTTTATANLYFDSVEDMEKLSFHLSSSIMEARETWSSEGK